jgi:hypothetical protein
MRARASLNNNPNTFLTIDSWTDALENSLKIPNAPSIDKQILGTAASLMIQDGKSLDGRPISQFRNLGQALSNNVSVVTEEGLRRHWKFYGLRMPVVTETGITKGTDKYANKPLLKAYIVWYNQNYKDNSLQLFSNTGNTNNIEEATGLSYSDTYSNTAAVMVEFLKACGLSQKDASEYGQNFEVGHIESQAFIRLKATQQAGEFYSSNFIEKIIKLHEYLDIASSSLLPEYEALTASVLKGTQNRNNLFVSVEMQLKDSKTKRDSKVGILASNTNQGSGRLSRALNFVALLRDIGSTEGIYSEDKTAFRKIGQDTEIIAVKLNEIYKNYKANLSEVTKALNSSFPNNKKEIANFLLDLKSSKTLRKHIKDTQLAALRKTKVEPFAAKVKPVSVKSFTSTVAKGNTLEKEIKEAAKRIKSNLSKLKQVKKKSSATVGPALKLKVVADQSNVNLPKLLVLINSQLQSVVSSNMGDGTRRDILNYRTGRLASSAAVESLTMSRQGMISAFYSYMKYPYATFSEGGRQQYPKTRDPKLLISNSIRQIAEQVVTNKLRAFAL